VDDSYTEHLIPKFSYRTAVNPMHETYLRLASLSVVMALLLPTFAAPFISAYSPGDEAQVFGHTFDEEYWTNSSIFVEGENGNATLTASYVGVEEFSAFLIAFNEIKTNDGDELIVPYQLFGMHYKTPNNTEVFIGAIFAFLMIHNESYGNNDLPDVGNEESWYVVPVTGNGNPWPDVTPSVESINATKEGENHYRFGMRYTNLPARIVAATGVNFLFTLGFPILTILISELEITYDIRIDDDGEVHAETLYTIGQVTRARWLGIFEADPADLINESLKISAVHYLSIWTSNYNVTRSSDGNTIAKPTDTEPMNDNITIRVGDDNERAFDIGFGRSYDLYNESTEPWTHIPGDYTALNALLAARASDFLLIAWQAPLSVFLFAHMAYALSAQLQSTYNNVQAMVNNAGTAFDNSQWWYAVTFPDWNGLRIQQDPVYVAYTSIAQGPTEPPRTLGLILVVGTVAVVIVVVVIWRRR